MISSTDLYIRELEKLLETGIERLMAELAAGSCKTIDDYRHKTGQIFGLSEAQKMMADANKITQQKLNGG